MTKEVGAKFKENIFVLKIFRKVSKSRKPKRINLVASKTFKLEILYVCTCRLQRKELKNNLRHVFAKLSPLKKGDLEFS